MCFSTRNRGFSPTSGPPCLVVPKLVKSQTGPRTLAWGPGLSPLVGALHSLLDWCGCRASGAPYPHLHLFLSRDNDLPILVSQLSWNSRVGKFISVAEFENNPSDAVEVVNGLYRHHVGPGFLQPPGVQLPPAAFSLLFVLVSTVLCSTCDCLGGREGFSGGRTG